MQIYIFFDTQVKKTITLKVDPTDTVEHIKQTLADKYDFPFSWQLLIFDRKRLEDHRTLSYYNISEQSTIIARVNLREIKRQFEAK